MSLESEQAKNQKVGGLLLLFGILLIGSNLRAPLTSVGSLVPIIRDTLGVSHTLIGTITTLPLLAFALVSPFAPKIANKLGMERTIFISMIILVIGILLRSVTGVSTLFIGTAFIGIAISFGNVLIPGLVKMSFPFRIGAVTGLYAVFMNTFGALASGVSVPLSEATSYGWQGALAAWAILAVVAMFVWFPQVKRPADLPDYDVDTQHEKTNMWSSLTAWQVTVFMGLQSLMFYTVLTWLPEILQVNGYTASEAGWMLSLMQFALIPVTFIMPIIATKVKDQKWLSVMTGLFFFVGTLGLINGQQVIVIIAVILLGIACGSAFSLSMIFFTLRTKDAYAASELSGMAQSIGYLLAAFGPMLFGGLHDIFNNWTAPLFLLLICSGVILIAGVLAGRNIVIDAPQRGRA